VQATLRPDEALIATFVSGEKTYVWAAPGQGGVAFAAAPLGRDRLEAAVRDLRRALDPGVRKLGDIPDYDIRLAQRLYQALLKPVEAGWKNARSLIIVGHRALGQLPFAALVTAPTRLPAAGEPLFSNYRSVPWLARTHSVTVLPSVSSLALLRNLPPAASTRRAFVGFGDPVFSKLQAAGAAEAGSGDSDIVAMRGVPARGLRLRLRAAPKLAGASSANLASLPRLPDTAEEVRNMALALNADFARDVFTGEAAGEERVKSMALSGYKVLAFATHGLVPGDLDGLAQPALALSSPDVTGGRDDGLLTMGEILSLKLDADWVVLSACNTASGDGAGAEAISGLGRAFFYAGTRALLVSGWPVETSSAKALTTDLFRRQAADPTLTRADALRQAMLGLIDGPGFRDAQGRTVFSYGHPIFWAPFSLVGDGGGGQPSG
jgi:CHAT domain-containing protein